MDTVEKWRYRGPRGHTGWGLTGLAFWCGACYRDGATGRFERIHDRKTDEYPGVAEFEARVPRVT